MNPEIQRYFSFALITALRNLRNRSTDLPEAESVYQDFAVVVSGFNPVTCATEEIVKEKLWLSSINKKEELIFFIIEILSGIRLSAAFGTINYGDLVNELAVAFSCFCSDKTNIIDKDWVGRTVFANDQSISEFKELLKNNGWMVVLLIAKFVDLKAIAMQVLVHEPANH